MEKNVYLSIDDKILARFLINKNTTVKALLEEGNSFLKSLGKNPDNYSISLKVDTKHEIKGLFNPKYENISPYNQVKEGYLIYTSDIFSTLSKDTLATLFATMRSVDINNFCVTSRKMLKICSNEDFWKRVNIYKFGKDISLGIYPSWKSRFLDSDDTSKVLKSIFGTKGIYMSPYTPYRKFIMDLSSSLYSGLKNSHLIRSIYFDPNIKYDYKNLDSLPVSLDLTPIYYHQFTTTEPRQHITANNLDYFNDEERYILEEKIARGKAGKEKIGEKKLVKLEKGRYYYKFILVRPFFTVKIEKGEIEIISYGVSLLAYEFRLRAGGWWREIIPLPFSPPRSYPNAIYDDDYYLEISKYF